MMIDSYQATLEDAEIIFDGISVDSAANLFATAMNNNIMAFK